MILTFKSQFLQGQSQMHLRAMVALDGGVFLLNQLQDIPALHSDSLLSLFGLADTYLYHLQINKTLQLAL